MSEQKQMTPFDAGLELWKMEKPEGDVDLVKQVRDDLLAAGCTEEGLVRNFDEHRHIKMSVGKTSPVQRANIVRYTDIVLKRSVVPTNLMSELTISGSLEPWSKHMKSKVTPFIAKHKLLEK